MNTVGVLHRWIERESTVQIAERLGIDRGTISRQLNGHLGISSKHIAAYLEAVPDDLRADLLGAWLRDTIPADLHAQLLDESGLPRQEVTTFIATPDKQIRERLQWLERETALDSDLRKALVIFCEWMGYEEPIEIERKMTPISDPAAN